MKVFGENIRIEDLAKASTIRKLNNNHRILVAGKEAISKIRPEDLPRITQKDNYYPKLVGSVKLHEDSHDITIPLNEKVKYGKIAFHSGKYDGYASNYIVFNKDTSNIYDSGASGHSSTLNAPHGQIIFNGYGGTDKGQGIHNIEFAVFEDYLTWFSRSVIEQSSGYVAIDFTWGKYASGEPIHTIFIEHGQPTGKFYSPFTVMVYKYG